MLTSRPIPDVARRTRRALFRETARPHLDADRTEDGRVIVGGEDRPNGTTVSAIAATLVRDAWLGRVNPDAAIVRVDRPAPR